MELGVLPFDRKLVHAYLSVFKHELSDDETESSSSSSSDEGQSEEDPKSGEDFDYGGILVCPQAYSPNLTVSSAHAHPRKRVKGTVQAHPRKRAKVTA